MADTEHDAEAFRDKLRAWRREGMNVFTYGGRGGHGCRQDFHELPSNKQRENDHVRELKAAGIQFERSSR